MLRCGRVVGLWRERRFWGVGHREGCVLAVPNAALYGGIGEARGIREVGSATLLRLVAPPKVTAAHRLLAGADAVWVPAAVPVLFWEPMGGESGDGVTGDGGPGLPGVWGCGEDQKRAGWGWLTRRRGRCPRAPARDSSPLDPRQGGMAPLGTAICAGAGVGQRPRTAGRWKPLRCFRPWEDAGVAGKFGGAGG